jgi:hypothetical protein
VGLFINGNYYSFADIETRITGIGTPLTAALIVGFTSVNYNDKLGRAYVRGTQRMPIGASSGQYEASGDFEMHKPQADTLITRLGPNWRQISLTLTVAYSTVGPLGLPGLPVSVDVLNGVYLTDLDAPNADGIESLKRKFTMFIVGGINWSGVPTPGFVEFKFPLAIG